MIYSEKFYSGLKGEDTIQIGNSEPIKDKVSFVVANEFTSVGTNLNKYAFFGLKNSNNDDMYNLNIISQMKDNNLINYPTWFLSFNSDSKGKFVIGTLPHLYDNITYNETDMSTEKCRAPCNILSVQFQEIWHYNHLHGGTCPDDSRRTYRLGADESCAWPNVHLRPHHLNGNDYA